MFTKFSINTLIKGVHNNIILFNFSFEFDNLRYRKRGKDKSGHSLNGSVLGYTDPAGEKLLPQNGTLNR